MDELLIEITVESLDEGGYLATSEILPGLVAQGRTVAETIEIAQDVARRLLDSYREHGDLLPPGLKNQAKRRRKRSDIKIAVAVDTGI